jgi:hypothetical protein
MRKWPFREKQNFSKEPVCFAKYETKRVSLETLVGAEPYYDRAPEALQLYFIFKMTYTVVGSELEPREVDMELLELELLTSGPELHLKEPKPMEPGKSDAID